MSMSKIPKLAYRKLHRTISTSAIGSGLLVFLVLVSFVVLLFGGLNCSKSKPTKPQQPKLVIEFEQPDWELRTSWHVIADDTIWSWYWYRSWGVHNTSREYLHDVLCWFIIQLPPSGYTYNRYEEWSDFRPKEKKGSSYNPYRGQYEGGWVLDSIEIGETPQFLDYGIWWEEY